MSISRADYILSKITAIDAGIAQAQAHLCALEVKFAKMMFLSFCCKYFLFLLVFGFLCLPHQKTKNVGAVCLIIGTIGVILSTVLTAFV